MKFSEIIKVNNELGLKITSQYDIAILSNITISQAQPIFELKLRQQGIDAVCQLGEYDNIIQDCERFKGVNAIVVFWEACNIIDGFQYKVNLLSDDEVDQILEKTKEELSYLFGQLSNTSIVIFNKFSSSIFNSHLLKENKFDIFCNRLNDFITENAPANFFLINLEKIYNQISIERSIDFRNYYSSKALYTVDFLKYYINYVASIFLSIKGKTKKALILDCDNTLWDGIVGEDGVSGIKLDASTTKGAIFQEVQSIVKSLAQQGILIGLCSKNNYQDVQDVFDIPSLFLLNDSDLVIKKINWEDKATNLRSIANELNIGIDSLVFVDDSDFEVNLVKSEVPEIEVLQVSKSIFDYPSAVRKLTNLFYKKNITKEDVSRVKMYKQEAERTISKSNFTDIDSYIKSLGLHITVYKNEKNLVQRIAQLTNKTNQFNLTTKRYTEADILSKMESEKTDIIAISVKDKFGDFGITGVAILDTNVNVATIDTFLMSCRVLGRKVESHFLKVCLSLLFNSNCSEVIGIYAPTPKNSQVKNFYFDHGFVLTDDHDGIFKYKLSKDSFKNEISSLIKIEYGN